MSWVAYYSINVMKNYLCIDDRDDNLLDSGPGFCTSTVSVLPTLMKALCCPRKNIANQYGFLKCFFYFLNLF